MTSVVRRCRCRRGRAAPLLTLANPLTAAFAGLVVLGQTPTAAQVVGLGIALIALVAGQTLGRPVPARPAERTRQLVAVRCQGLMSRSDVKV